MTPRRLADTLAETRDRAGAWKPLYDRFVEGLRALGVGTGAPMVGDPFPAFALPDATGHARSLDALIAQGPLVLSFNRGGWCPYCSHELRAWRELLPELRASGGHFAAITPEVGGRAALLGHLLDADVDLLCDVDHGVALTSGLAFYLGHELQHRYHEWGLDLAELYGNDSNLLPIPATFVIDREGVTRYAFADPDFRVRAEPAEVMAALRSLG